jgi:hypothetical protein
MGPLLNRTADVLIVLPTIRDRISACVTLLDALASRQHTRVDHDLLFVIDGDGRGLALPAGDGVTVVWRPERHGLVDAYNIGFSWFAQGSWSYLVMLEDGITVTEGWDAAMRDVLVKHPDFGWVACSQLEHPVPFTPLCSMMTRACALAVRGLDPWFAPCQFDDADLLLRCQLAGFTPHGVPHRVSHPEGRTSVAPADRQKDLELMHRNRQKFAARWSLPDSTLPRVPIHGGCDLCIPPLEGA